MTEQQTPEMPATVVIEPTCSGSYSHGWQTMKKYFIDFLLVFLIVIIVSLPMGLLRTFIEPYEIGYFFYTLLAMAYGIIVMGPVSYGVHWLFLKAARNEQFKTHEMFMAFQDIWNIVVANILVSIIVGIGIVLLIVPGIIFACRLAFVSYLVMDRKMEAVEAIKKSWDMTRGYSWTIFGMAILSFFIAIAGLICLGVGIIPAVIWIESAFASLYWAVTRKIETSGQNMYI